MVIFYSYVKLPEGNHHSPPLFPWGKFFTRLKDQREDRRGLDAHLPGGQRSGGPLRCLGAMDGFSLFF